METLPQTYVKRGREGAPIPVVYVRKEDDDETPEKPRPIIAGITFRALVLSGLTLAAALAWNEFAKQLFASAAESVAKNGSQTMRGKFLYAFVMTSLLVGLSAVIKRPIKRD